MGDGVREFHETSLGVYALSGDLDDWEVDFKNNVKDEFCQKFSITLSKKIRDIC